MLYSWVGIRRELHCNGLRRMITVSCAAWGGVLPARWGSGTFLSAQPWGGHIWTAGSGSWWLSTKSLWSDHSSSSPQIWFGDRNTFLERQRQVGLLSLEKRRLQCEMLLICISTWKKWRGNRLPLPNDRPRNDGHKLKSIAFHIKKMEQEYTFHPHPSPATVKWLNAVDQGDCGFSTHADIENLIGHGSGQPALADPTWAGCLGWKISRCPF